MFGKRDIPHRASFEKMGESHVRFLAESRPDDAGPAARAWLAEKQAEREEAAASKRDAREEETLAIAKRANRIAIAACISAAIAAIAAIISAIITITRN